MGREARARGSYEERKAQAMARDKKEQERKTPEQEQAEATKSAKERQRALNNRLLLSTIRGIAAIEDKNMLR